MVIDTNVVVSPTSGEGLPVAILDLDASRRFLMCVSPAVLAEYKEVLNAPRFQTPAPAHRAVTGLTTPTTAEALP